MKIKMLLGLAAIGGLFYAHKRHGGKMNFKSIRSSAFDLLDFAKDASKDVRKKGSKFITTDMANRLESAAEILRH